MNYAGTVHHETDVWGSAGGVTGMESLPCRLVDPELFFAESPADVEYAKGLCRDCPVQQICLESAMDRHEPWGVWGGQLFVQGVVVARKRPRGRPRKHPLPDHLQPDHTQPEHTQPEYSRPAQPAAVGGNREEAA